MIRGLFGAGTMPAKVRDGLDEVSATHCGIASRVANALAPADASDFAFPLGIAETMPASQSLASVMTDALGLDDTPVYAAAHAGGEL